jgi:hypothetical protein
MMNPHGSGSSACVSRLTDESLKSCAETLLRSVGWRGMFMIELLRTVDGRGWFIEFNGRAWGSMALARRQGFEYPAWTVALALDGQAPRAAPKAVEGLVCRNAGRELMHLMFVARGRRSRAIRNWPTFASALRDVLRPHRGGSLYNWRSSDWRVFASDCLYTVGSHLRRSGRT